jgi:hypothetical protein
MAAEWSTPDAKCPGHAGADATIAETLSACRRQLTADGRRGHFASSIRRGNSLPTYIGVANLSRLSPIGHSIMA